MFSCYFLPLLRGLLRGTGEWKMNGFMVVVLVWEILRDKPEQVPYEVAWSWQKVIVWEKKAQIEKEGDCTDTLILQHPSVYTLGTASMEENIKFDMKNAPFNIYCTECGGDVTYHGPGQLCTLLSTFGDTRWIFIGTLELLEDDVIRVLSSFSIQASRLEGLTGVWVGKSLNPIDVTLIEENEKLAAVGITVSPWIIYHGLALNDTTNLCPFKWIVPCGIHSHGCQVGSIKGLVREGKLCIDHGIDLHHLDDASLIHITHKSLIEEFSQAFQLEYCYKNISAAKLYERKHSSLTK